ncbi:MULTISPECIES: cytoplasmic protein [Bacillus cereus group]|uniref:cytoplasmic protein n=1 Tax=Bacillus cereus group TaxID=86661 RepID=UPI0021110C96|nr:cytoplasmic protein [Bacillus cereus]
MNNDAKGLTFLTLSLLFLWLVFDDFVGKKRLSKLAQMMTPDLSMPSAGEVAEKVVDGAKESVKETTKNTREAQKEADKKAGEILFEKPAKNAKDPKTKEVLERLSEQSKKRAQTNAYKDKGWLGYSWEDLFEDTWGTVKGWFK